MITAESQVGELEIKEKRYAVRTDVRGLSVTVFSTGGKSYTFRGRSIGRTSEISFDEARNICIEILRKEAGRVKPKAKPVRTRKPATPAADQLVEQLFGVLIFSWLTTHHFDDCPKNDKTLRARADFMARNSLLVELGPLPVGSITPEILKKVFIGLVKQEKRDAAGRCRRILEAFFGHLVKREIVKTSPAGILENMVFTGKNAMKV